MKTRLLNLIIVITILIVSQLSSSAYAQGKMTVNAGIDQTVCAGDSVTLSAVATGGTAPITYTWISAGPGGFLQGQTVKVVLQATTTYTLTARDLLGNNATDAIIITVKPKPTASAGQNVAICYGSSTALTATGGGTYLWSTNENTNVITPAPQTTTTYTVTVTSLLGCKATAAVTVTVNKLTIRLTPDHQICDGGSDLLVAGGGNKYLWNTGSTSNKILVKPTVNTTYTCTFTDTKSGCSESATVAVSIGVALITDAGIDQTICAGLSVSLRAAGGSTFTWSTGATTQTISVTPTVATTYKVTASDGVCQAEDSVIVSIDTPLANAGVDTLICAGTSVTLTATGGVIYRWNTNATTQTITVKPTVKTTYTVTATTINGCSATDAVVVTLNTAPTVNIGGANQVCAGTSISLTATTNGNSYAWSTGATTATITVNPIANTTYTVTVSNTTGCTASKSAFVIVNPLPTANAGVDAAICAGTSATLSAATGGGGTTWVAYKWSNNANTQITTVTPTVTTTYSLTVTNQQTQCSASDDIIITVNTSPTADAGLDATICSGETIDIAATGGVSYYWSTKDTIATITVTPTKTTTYTVTVTGDNGCTASDAMIITVNPSPTVNAGKDVAICKGTSTNLTATATNGVGIKWSTGSSTQSISVSPTATTTYTVTVSTMNFCTATDEVIVTVNPLPTANAGVDTSVCLGSSINLTAIGGNTYVWNHGGATTAVITVTPTVKITYTVTATNLDGCTAIDAIVVSVNSLPTADAGTNDTITQGNSIQFNATAIGGTPTYNYSWSPTTTLDNADINNPIASPSGSALYELTVSDSKGCSDTDQKYVVVQGIPGVNAGIDATICFSTSTQLSAIGFGGTGNYTYSWTPAISLDDTTIANPVATPDVTTTYTIQLTDEAGKIAIDEVIVTVNSVNADAGQDVTICSGTSTTLSALGGISYLWNTGSKLSTISVSPKNSSTYTVSVTGADGCTASDNVIVTLNALPTANPGSPALICSGDSVQLDASGGVTFNWSNGATTALTYVKPLVTSTYTVTVADDNLCTNSAQVVVTVNPTPTVNAGKDVSLCIGSSVNLTATSDGISFRWNTGTMSATIKVSPTVTSTYSVTASTPNFCSATDEVVVTVTPLPTANAGLDTTICVGTTISLTASGGDTYLWSNGGGNITTAINPVTPNANRTYTVTVTVGACTASDQVIVTVNALPTVNAGVDQAICIGGSTSITAASNGILFEWSTTQQTASISVAPIVTTIYSVSASDANGCSAKDAVIVTVNSLPTVNAGKDDFICKYNPLQLNGSSTGIGLTYAWTSVGKISNVAIANPTVSTNDTSAQVDEDIAFKLSVTDNKGCKGTDSLVVTFMASCNLKVAAIASSSAICAGGSTFLSAWAQNGITPYTFVWDHSLPVGGGPIKVTPAVTTDYTVVVIDGSGARDTAVVTITVNQLPTVTAGTNVSVCKGSATDLIANGTGVISYAWNTGATTSLINVSPVVKTTYTVTGIDNNSCANTSQVEVTVNALPTVSLGQDTTLCSETSLLLSPGAFTSYNWTINGNAASTASTLSVDTNGIGVTIAAVQLVVKDNNNCQATDDINVTFYNCITMVNNETSDLTITIYPNPSKGILNMNFAGITQEMQVTLISIDGQLISNWNVNANNQYTIDMTSYAKGVYFIKLQNNETVLVKKIVLD